MVDKNSRYIVFKWERFYPAGGWNDAEAGFNTYAEVEAYHVTNPLKRNEIRQVIGPDDFEWEIFKDE